MTEGLGDFFKLIAEDKKKKKEEFNELVGDLGLDSLFSEIGAEKKKIKEAKERAAAKLVEEEKKKREQFDKLVGGSIDDLFQDLIQAKKDVVEDKKQEEERQKQVLNSFESFLTKKIEDIEEIKEEIVAEEPVEEEVEEEVVEEVIEEVVEDKSLIEKSLGLLSEPSEVVNADQNFATLEDLQKHYREFLGKIQQQLSTLGGGGIEDAPKTGGPYARRNQAWEVISSGGVGAGSTWAVDTVGINTTKNVGIGTTAKDGYSLYVQGDARITGILTVGESSVTINGTDDKIIIGSGTTITEGGNAEYVGVITATSFSGSGSNITGISTLNITNYGIGITFTQTGTGATTRTVDSKLKDIVSVTDFGAVGDGVTDDKDALKAALESGKIVDGGNRTYAISGTLKPTSFHGLQNAKLVQIAADNSTENYDVLFLEGLSDFIIRDVLINMGSDVTTLFADDGRNGLKIWGTLSGIGTNQTANYSTDFTVDNVTVTGNGCGTGVHIRHSARFKLVNSTVRDRVSGSTPDPTNDSQNGFAIIDCEDFTVDSCIASNLKTRLSGVNENKWTRGFLFAEIRECTITGCLSNVNDQGFDFSGTVFDTSPSYYEGNRYFNVSGCEANNNGTFGFKFANTTHDGLINGCIATNIAAVGFVVSSKNETSGTLSNNSYRTQNLTFTGCKVVNSLNNHWGSFSSHGFYVDEQTDGPAAYPRNVKFVGCDVTDNQSSPTTQNGFSTSVDPIVVPNTGYNTNMTVSTANCTVSNVVTPFNNIHHAVCSVSGSDAGTASDSTWTTVTLQGTDRYDPSGLHSTSSNSENVFIKESGIYQLEAFTVWNDGSNGTGERKLRFLRNGNAAGIGTEGVTFPTGVSRSAVRHSEIIQLNTGDSIRHQIYQNSGGSINYDRSKSTLTVTRIS